MIQMYINGEEVVCDKNIEINEELLATSSTVLKNCYPKAWEETHDYVNNFYFPEDYSKCLIYKDNELIFCGVVKNTGNISLNPREPHYCDLQILDFKTMLSEGETLDYVINNKTVEEAIEMVIDTIADYGFEKGNIQIAGASDIIGAYSTENKTAYDVFQYLADITQSKWFTRMVNDNVVAIDFYDPNNMPQKDDIQYTQEYFEENNIQDIKFNYSTKDYRNKQIMLSKEVYSNLTLNEVYVADGFNDFVTLSYNIGNLISVIVNGVSLSIATEEEEELGYDADCYYTPGKNTIRFDDLLAAGTQIYVNFVPLVKGRVIINNSDEIERVETNTGRKGTITRYEARNDALTTDELVSIGQSYIQYKGKAEIILKVSTYNNDMFNIGDITYFDAPLENLKLNYMVKKKTTSIIATTNDIFYQYELTSSYNSESDINYFDNQRAKASGNIGAGEFITRNIDIENTTTIIFNNLVIEEVEQSNILNSTLNAPFSN